MKLTPTITLAEFAGIMRDALEKKFNLPVDCVVIESYDQPRITIRYSAEEGADALVESTEFEHRTA